MIVYAVVLPCGALRQLRPPRGHFTARPFSFPLCPVWAVIGRRVLDEPAASPRGSIYSSFIQMFCTPVEGLGTCALVGSIQLWD